ncbi:MAG: 2-oxoglutarate dehydrogenase E1 component, partial [Verrucomicrobiota bacterium]|nr:2-oxoglutarate dehydrogenase E1 component [Verrucomicrobiota bacterium]
SLLRAEFCVSTVDDFTSGSFSEILPGPLLDAPEKIDRIVFCSGKIYYDLLNFREANARKNTAIIRIEQLYPLDEKSLRSEVEKFPNAEKFVWCQEESQNMGAWSYINFVLRFMFDRLIWYAGRNASASPAVGALATHKREQKLIVEDAFNL